LSVKEIPVVSQCEQQVCRCVVLIAALLGFDLLCHFAPNVALMIFSVLGCAVGILSSIIVVFIVVFISCQVVWSAFFAKLED